MNILQVYYNLRISTIYCDIGLGQHFTGLLHSSNKYNIQLYCDIGLGENFTGLLQSSNKYIIL